MCPRSASCGPGMSKIIVFFCQASPTGTDFLEEILVQGNICQNQPFGNHPFAKPRTESVYILSALGLDGVLRFLLLAIATSWCTQLKSIWCVPTKPYLVKQVFAIVCVCVYHTFFVTAVWPSMVAPQPVASNIVIVYLFDPPPRTALEPYVH